MKSGTLLIWACIRTRQLKKEPKERKVLYENLSTMSDFGDNRLPAPQYYNVAMEAQAKVMSN